MAWSFLLRSSAACLLLATSPMVLANDNRSGEVAGSWFEGAFDLAEIRIGKGSDSLAWEGGISYGSENHRIVAEFEGTGEVGYRIDEIEAKLLYEHALGSGFAVMGGVRHDFRPAPHNTYAVLGVEGGLADTISIKSMAYLSDKGDVTGESEIAIAQPLMPRFIADARAELGWAAQAIPVEDTGSGLTEAEFSLRLRYEGIDRLAPYIGVIHGRLLGDTAEIARNIGEPRTATDFVVGVSFSFGGPQN